MRPARVRAAIWSASSRLSASIRKWAPQASSRRRTGAAGIDRVSSRRRHLLPQQAPEDLAGRTLRQLVDEAVLARTLEAGQRLGGEAEGVELLRDQVALGDHVR